MLLPTEKTMGTRGPGIVTLAILRAIQSGRRYGADIMEATALGGGTVYKTLGRLERRGWVEGAWEDPAVAEAGKRPRRRFYDLTPEGEAAAAEALRRVVELTGHPSTA
jgi:DNA-binding PadR family transcriptional regulator